MTNPCFVTGSGTTLNNAVIAAISDGCSDLTIYSASIPADFDTTVTNARLSQLASLVFSDIVDIANGAINNITFTELQTLNFLNQTDLTGFNIWFGSTFPNIKTVNLPSPNIPAHLLDSANLSALSDLIIPNSVTRIGTQAFRNTNLSGLTSLTFPSSLNIIDVGAFNSVNLGGISSLVFPAFISDIKGDNNTGGTTAFGEANFSDLKTITFLNQADLTGRDIWRDTSFPNIKTVNLPSPNIPAHLLDSANLSALSDLVIPNGVTRIGVEAFRNTNLSGLTSLIFPTNLHILDAGAFNGVNLGGISSLTFPSSISDIKGDGDENGLAAFGDIIFNSLQTLTFLNQADLTGFNIWLNTAFPNIKTVNLPSPNIPAHLLDSANLSALSDLVIPNGVTRIGSQAFRKTNLSGLKSFIFPSSLHTIDVGAFNTVNLSGISSLVFPTSLSDIKGDANTGGTTAFGEANFSDLKTLTFLNQADLTGTFIWLNTAFPNIKTVNLPHPNIPNHLLHSANLSILSDVIFPSDVTRIGTQAFRNTNLSGLNALIFPSTLTTIAGGAFDNANISNVQKLCLPKSATFDNSTFAGIITSNSSSDVKYLAGKASTNLIYINNFYGFGCPALSIPIDTDLRLFNLFDYRLSTNAIPAGLKIIRINDTAIISDHTLSLSNYTLKTTSDGILRITKNISDSNPLNFTFVVQDSSGRQGMATATTIPMVPCSISISDVFIPPFSACVDMPFDVFFDLSISSIKNIATVKMTINGSDYTSTFTSGLDRSLSIKAPSIPSDYVITIRAEDSVDLNCFTTKTTTVKVNKITLSDLRGGPVCTNSAFNIFFNVFNTTGGNVRTTLNWMGSDYVSDFTPGLNRFFRVTAPSFSGNRLARITAQDKLNPSCSDIKTTIVQVEHVSMFANNFVRACVDSFFDISYQVNIENGNGAHITLTWLGSDYISDLPTGFQQSFFRVKAPSTITTNNSDLIARLKVQDALNLSCSDIATTRVSVGKIEVTNIHGGPTTVNSFFDIIFDVNIQNGSNVAHTSLTWLNSDYVSDFTIRIQISSDQSQSTPTHFFTVKAPSTPGTYPFSLHVKDSSGMDCDEIFTQNVSVKIIALTAPPTDQFVPCGSGTFSIPYSARSALSDNYRATVSVNGTDTIFDDVPNGPIVLALPLPADVGVYPVTVRIETIGNPPIYSDSTTFNLIVTAFAEQDSTWALSTPQGLQRAFKTACCNIDGSDFLIVTNTKFTVNGFVGDSDFVQFFQRRASDWIEDTSLRIDNAHGIQGIFDANCLTIDGSDFIAVTSPGGGIVQFFQRNGSNWQEHLDFRISGLGATRVTVCTIDGSDTLVLPNFDNKVQFYRRSGPGWAEQASLRLTTDVNFPIDAQCCKIDGSDTLIVSNINSQSIRFYRRSGPNWAELPGLRLTGTELGPYQPTRFACCNINGIDTLAVGLVPGDNTPSFGVKFFQRSGSGWAEQLPLDIFADTFTTGVDCCKIGGTDTFVVTDFFGNQVRFFANLCASDTVSGGTSDFILTVNAGPDVVITVSGSDALGLTVIGRGTPISDVTYSWTPTTGVTNPNALITTVRNQIGNYVYTVTARMSDRIASDSMNLRIQGTRIGYKLKFRGSFLEIELVIGAIVPFIPTDNFFESLCDYIHNIGPDPLLATIEVLEYSDIPFETQARILTQDPKLIEITCISDHVFFKEDNFTIELDTHGFSNSDISVSYSDDLTTPFTSVLDLDPNVEFRLIECAIAFAGEDRSILMGQTTQLGDGSSFVANTIYTWSSSDYFLTTVNTLTPTVRPLQTTTYTLTAQSPLFSDCTDTSSVTVTVLPCNLVISDIIAPSVVCLHEVFNLGFTIYGTGAYTNDVFYSVNGVSGVTQLNTPVVTSHVSPFTVGTTNYIIHAYLSDLPQCSDTKVVSVFASDCTPGTTYYPAISNDYALSLCQSSMDMVLILYSDISSLLNSGTLYIADPSGQLNPYSTIFSDFIPVIEKVAGAQDGLTTITILKSNNINSTYRTLNCGEQRRLKTSDYDLSCCFNKLYLAIFGDMSDYITHIPGSNDDLICFVLSSDFTCNNSGSDITLAICSPSNASNYQNINKVIILKE